MRTRSTRWALALFLPLALFGAACGDDADGDGGGAGGGSVPIVIGAQDFGESKILAEIYAQALTAAGYEVSVQELGGFRDLVISGFEGGDINLAPEYAASMLEFLNEDVSEATADAAETTALLQGYLDDLGLVALDPSAAVDTNAFVVTEETSTELGITAISDLADHQDLTLGAPADCETNPFCLPGLQEVYGVDLSAGFTALEAGAISDALDAGAIDVALLFSTDSRIATNGYVLLEDDQQMLAADNVLPVLTEELAGDAELVAVLDAISAALTTANLTELNRRFDVDVEDPEDIAASFLADNGLV